MSAVLIYSKNTLYRECLKETVNAHSNVSAVYCVDDKNNIDEVLSNVTPEYALIDLYSRNFDEDILLEINKHFPSLLLILLTTIENKYINYYSNLYGIKHFVYAEASSEEIVEEIHDILSGKNQNGKNNHSSTILTARECQILKLISTGMTSKEIADCLCISKNTVDTHRNKMLQKLSLANSASLVHYAYKSGLF
ncbi:MAG: hypothetical protein C0602_12575 [Denitrovibrio sp.]|nr:MAG: hypothetical protein C0602_12575 [Denitrovibrio sp.]